ncbi:MAG TPA: 2-oxoacid:acceptor oxidoreductase family protein, partial [Planctomycetaceae bacterium]|nr:2-oxoacid:acceptor oxidoreductase family protein [Planctomycetaceae bacterium]
MPQVRQHFCNGQVLWDNQPASLNFEESAAMIVSESASLTTLIAGVGGQGVVLAGGVLAQAALLSGYDVRQSEMHGLSQRFGSVSSQIRIGKGLYSPHRGHGAVDLLVSLEGYEAFKQLPFLRAEGTALVNRLWRKPIPAKPTASVELPELDDPRVVWFAGTELTQQAECPRSLNFFMLGVLSTRLDIDEAHWHEAIET